MSVYYRIRENEIEFDTECVEEVGGEKVHEFTDRVLAASGFTGRMAAVYAPSPGSDVGAEVKPIGRSILISDKLSMGGGQTNPFSVVLMPQQQLAPSPKFVSFKQGRQEFKVDICGVRSLDGLKQLANSTLNTSAALGLLLVQQGQADLQLNTDALVLNLRPGAVIAVKNLRIGFSDVKDETKALEILGFTDKSTIPHDNSVFSTFEGTASAEVDSNNEYVQHAVATIAKLQKRVPFPMKTECSARLYIDAILLAAALLAEGLEMSVEQMYESPLVRGPLDYVFYHNLICVCVAEGKKDCITHGIAQNFAQLSAVRYNKRKRRNEAIPVACYGIATTFSLWVFTRVDENNAAMSQTYTVDPSDPESIKKMIVRVMLLLRHCKSEVDAAASASKRHRP